MHVTFSFTNLFHDTSGAEPYTAAFSAMMIRFTHCLDTLPVWIEQTEKGPKAYTYKFRWEDDPALRLIRDLHGKAEALQEEFLKMASKHEFPTPMIRSSAYSSTPYHTEREINQEIRVRHEITMKSADAEEIPSPDDTGTPETTLG